MSDTHRVNIVRIDSIRPHPNADKLELTDIGGYQVVIGKGSFQIGDLAVYIQPDSVVPQTKPFYFIWGPHVPKTYVNSLEGVAKGEIVFAFGEEGSPEGTKYWIQSADGIVPEKRRRITVKRLRKEYSEGLLMPLADVGIVYTENCVGLDVADIIGVTHYVPEFDRESTAAETAATPKRRRPKTLRGWFYWALWKLGIKGAQKDYAQEVSFNLPVYDVDALKNHKNWFTEGDIVQVTEKIHGSNARYTFIPDNENDPLSDGLFYVGSREQWKIDGPNVWWNVARQHPEIEEWCRQNPGKVLYGEVGPTQKGFRYGAANGETFFFAFDVYDPKTGSWTWAGNEGFSLLAPALYVGPYDLTKIAEHVDGKSTVPSSDNIREGVVVRRLSDNQKLKIVSNSYLEKDSK